MKAAFIKAPYQIEIRELEMPEPGYGEALLKVEMVGLCGTDLHLAQGWAKDWTRFGHETVASVAAVGPGVTDLREGQMVCVRGTTMCGVCKFCMAGKPASCLGWRSTRLQIGLSEYVVAPRRSIWVTSGVDLRTASLIEPLAVALDVVETADVQMADVVAVIGPGPIGIMSIRLAKLNGARKIIAVGTGKDRDRFDLCRELGADVCIDVDEDDTAEVVARETAGVGLDRLIVTAPPAVVPSALRLGRYGAVVSFVGFADDEEGATVSLDLNALHTSKLQLRASSSAPVAQFSIANELLAAGALPADRIVTHLFPLEELEKALRLAASHDDGVIKATIQVAEATEPSVAGTEQLSTKD